MTGDVCSDGCRNESHAIYIVVGVGSIQRIPRISGPGVHNPQKFIIILDNLLSQQNFSIVSVIHPKYLLG